MKKFETYIKPDLTKEQLFEFYKKNNICEEGHGIETAARVLKFSSLIVGVFDKETLVGLARAMFDGNDAYIAELSLAVTLQGKDLQYKNGSLIEADPSGVGKKLGMVLLNELEKMGAQFISASLVEHVEENFYRSLGLIPNTGHLVYYRDRRTYVSNN